MTITCGLIKGRHAVPADVSVFVFDADIPQAHISDSSFFDDVCTRFLDRFGPSAVDVYVTGFTPALLSLIKICDQRGVKLSAYNYDRDHRNFWRQEVLI